MNYKNVKISEDARIAKQSVVIGDVTIGRDSCVLHYAVIRGDDAPVVIGEESNIQENCTIHVNHNMPVHIGNNVTVGHNAVLHGCVIGDRTIPSKSLEVSYLTITDYDAAFWKICTIALIPGIFLVIGFVVWIKRRKA